MNHSTICNTIGQCLQRAKTERICRHSIYKKNSKCHLKSSSISKESRIYCLTFIRNAKFVIFHHQIIFWSFSRVSHFNWRFFPRMFRWFMVKKISQKCRLVYKKACTNWLTLNQNVLTQVNGKQHIALYCTFNV